MLPPIADSRWRMVGVLLTIPQVPFGDVASITKAITVAR